MCAVYCALVKFMSAIFSLVVSALSLISIPIAPLNSVFVDNWFLANSGIPQAIGIIGSALMVRFALSLIPFFRL